MLSVSCCGGSLATLAGAQPGAWGSRQGQISGHRAGIPPGSGAAARLSHLPFAPGKPQHPVPVPQQVWAETLSFGRPTQRHVRSWGPPLSHSGWAGRELHPKFRGVPPSWPCFPRLGGLGAGGGGGCQPGPLDTGPRQQLPSTGGCHSAAEQPGTGTPNPCLTPVCPPAPRWHGSGSGLVALGTTLRWRQGQRRGRCRSWAGVWRGGSLRRGVGAPGAAGAPGLGRARQPCVTAAPQTRPT